MPTWIIPIIQLVGPLLVKIAESVFSRKIDEPRTGPEKKRYVLNWLIATWDLLTYLEVIPEKLAKKRDLILRMFGAMIDEWVEKLKKEGKLLV